MLAELVGLCRSLKRVQDDGRYLVSNFAPSETTWTAEDPEWLAAYGRLHSWGIALVNTVRLNFDELESVVTGIASIPEGCPSKGSMAMLVARQIEKKIIEVQGAFSDLKTAIWETGNTVMEADRPSADS